MRRILVPLALAGTLTLAGCQNPDGSTDWGSTLALGAGVGLAAGLLAATSLNDDDDDRRHQRRRQNRSYGYGDRDYGPRYSNDGGYGPPRPYRRW